MQSLLLLWLTVSRNACGACIAVLYYVYYETVYVKHLQQCIRK